MNTIFNKSRPDIVFIGSSTTKYHASTNMFKANNIKIFNYGLEGHFFTAYPTMIDNAIKLHPKVIAISIDSPELYYSLLIVESAFDKNINLYSANVLFFIKHYFYNLKNLDEFQFINRILKVYLAQFNYLMVKGYKVKNFIANRYDYFNPPTTVKRNVDTNTLLPQELKMYVDCGEMSSPIETTLACKNGDGILFGKEKNVSYDEFNKTIIFSDKNYNYALASILNTMMNKIRQAHIVPVVIFLPQFNNSVVNQNLIKHTLQADIVDLTQFRIPVDGWYNTGHFNEKGRFLYSQQLVRRMKPLIRTFERS